MRNSKSFREIEREVDKKTATVMSYTYPQYHDSNATTDDVERICGYLTETEVLPEMLRACSIEDGNGTPNLGQTTESWKGNTRCQIISSFSKPFFKTKAQTCCIFSALFLVLVKVNSLFDSVAGVIY